MWSAASTARLPRNTQYCAPMASETTRPSSRESPSACGPIAGGDAAPGVDSKTEQKRRDGIADCLPGSAMPRSAAPRTTQPMAKAWPSAIGERTRAATNCWERDQRPLPPRCTSSQVRSTGFGSAILSAEGSASVAGIVLDASEPHRTRRSGGLDEWGPDTVAHDGVCSERRIGVYEHSSRFLPRARQR